ncbi:hypothetical protein RRG08_030146 [Elysia crispata]|uniref:Uncharacterized protein n=1 Tax=Elysia crispata TaxID=231223 RepID=A0AAE0ZR93_9GAST|nr:hypothetical protein RRG08_030146 [Elysia crispata]
MEPPLCAVEPYYMESSRRLALISPEQTRETPGDPVACMPSVNFPPLAEKLAPTEVTSLSLAAVYVGQAAMFVGPRETDQAPVETDKAGTEMQPASVSNNLVLFSS